MDPSPQKNVGSVHQTKYTTERYGIWEVLMVDENYRAQYLRFIHDFPKLLPYLCRLFQDIYSLSPEIFPRFICLRLWLGCQESIKLHFSGEVLRAIEQCLKEGVADYYAVAYAIILRCGVAGLASFFSWYSQQVMLGLQRRVTSHFQLRIMSTVLGRDLADKNSPSAQINVSAKEAWTAFEEVLQHISTVLTVVSQLGLIFYVSAQDKGGILFALLCLLHPIVSTLVTRSLWNKVCIVRETSRDQQRIEALTTLIKPEFRQDVIGNNLQAFILSEYQETNERLRNVSVEQIWRLYGTPSSPASGILTTFLSDLPLIYCALTALRDPKRTSFASIAILQQSSVLLSRWVAIALSGSEHFRSGMKHIQDIYESTEKPGKNGITDLKQIGLEDATLRVGEGIELELRNVSFEYPGTKANREALRNISLKIKPGQFVVLVGANGSGKSTLLKTLCRFFHPTACRSGCSDVSGQVLLDSIPAQLYSESSLRRTMAVLSQENMLYPGFTCLDEAVRKAGADRVVNRMKQGMDTLLEPLFSWYQYNVRDKDTDHPLKKVLQEMERPIEVSGGEKQRIVAARTFMRLKSGTIRFLAVDEPSSALDAEGEELLLSNLLRERSGKTIVFVTHRFGKLTRQADLILCMKEGQVIESGTHQELMNNSEGEYKKLYDIQASAFRDESS
ncbi:hypothetical protein NP233_g12074 [Leucocoprinus birnbaumii]|uniref:ABC transporter domain-containing protein n=1 Tax=Leucocoprinus birnbaumii TaxID=56174 RepID=A0AAD5VGC1_9AGAR|nr:hypothetical protein NP233_g12074 [Leucocoprinus birnbaumii]